MCSVATPCLECVEALVHEFMSTLHPMSGPPPYDSYMESWVPLCVTFFVSHSPWLWSTPCLEYVHTSVHEFMSTWLLMSGPAPMHSSMETSVAPCMAVCLCPSHLISVATPCLECVHGSV